MKTRDTTESRDGLLDVDGSLIASESACEALFGA